jgi:hypothetical protein
MLRHNLIYLVLSFLVVLFAAYANLIIVYLDVLYTYANIQLTPIFSSGSIGVLIRKVLVLVFIPIIAVGIPALMYRLIKGKHMPYFIQTTWLVWLVLVLSKVLIQ